MTNNVIISAEEWEKLSPHSRHKLNKFFMAAQRIATKFALNSSAINEEDAIALNTLIGDWIDL